MRANKGQSILEYTILLCIIMSALLIMQVYIKRCYQGKLKHDADSVGQQYSPRHTTSTTTNNTNITTTSCTGGTCKGHAVDDGVTVTYTDTTNTTDRRETVDAFAKEG
ncbi:MAG: hypothetical protein V2A64_06215 [Candidatus Omnitrophota bacterium]